MSERRNWMDEQAEGCDYGGANGATRGHGCPSPSDDVSVAERNVLGADLQPCGTDPMTGFFRDGCCSTGPEDVGSHTICAVVTAEFGPPAQHRQRLVDAEAAVSFPGSGVGRSLVRDRGELGPCLQRRRGSAGRACLHP